MPDDEAVTALIRDVAKQAIMPYFRTLDPGRVRTKSHARDFVTIADTETERLLTVGLTAMCPGSVVVGEEGAENDPSVLEVLSSDRSVWIIDPVDGTANFVDGKEHFAVIVAFYSHGETRAGWIYEPVSERMVSARPGCGAWVEEGSNQPKRLALPAPKDLSEMVGILGGPSAEKLRRAIASGEVWAPARMKRLGSTGSEYIALATGDRDFAQYIRLKPWDHTAGVLIHAEAGGYSCLRHGQGRYQPGPEISKGAILLAPDKETWMALDAVL